MGKIFDATRSLYPIASRYKFNLILGCLGTLIAVLFRLSMPWPLRGILEVAFSSQSHTWDHIAQSIGNWGNPVLILILLYFIAAVGAGLAEVFQRVQCMRFSARTADHLRDSAIQCATAKPMNHRLTPAEMISWIVGDANRIKSGLSGLLVHGLFGILHFSLICTILMWMSPRLGVVLAFSGLAALGVSLVFSLRMARLSFNHHKKQGRMASTIYQLMSQDVQEETESDSSSVIKDKEAKSTKTVTTSTLMVHIILACTIGYLLWTGVNMVRNGSMHPGELFILVSYATTLHRSMVKAGRQAARSGAIVGCLERMEGLVGTNVGKQATHRTLQEQLTLEQVKLNSRKGSALPPRLRKLDVTIQAGSRVAVLGPPGSGKSSLLRIMAGLEWPNKGQVLWDGKPLEQDEILTEVGYLGQHPTSPSHSLSRILSSSTPQTDSSLQSVDSTLKNLGLSSLAKKLKNSGQTTFDSLWFSDRENLSLSLADFLSHNSSSLWLLDEPLEGLTSGKAHRRLQVILEKVAHRTLVIAMAKPQNLELFDQILVLRKGRLKFQGTSADWRMEKQNCSETSKSGTKDTITRCKP